MSGIGPGTPLRAPQGYKNLVASETYYFLRSSPKTGYVTLIRFVIRPPKQVEYKSAQKPKRTVTPQPIPNAPNLVVPP